MGRIPNLCAREVIGALKRVGFSVVSQRGSHVKLENGDDIKIIVPNHGGDIKRPLLKAIIKQAGLTEDRFVELL